MTEGMILACDMQFGKWYRIKSYTGRVLCEGPMPNGEHICVALDGDKDTQSKEGIPLDEEVWPVEDEEYNV